MLTKGLNRIATVLIKGKFNKIRLVFTSENVNKRLYDPKAEEKKIRWKEHSLAYLNQQDLYR